MAANSGLEPPFKAKGKIPNKAYMVFVTKLSNLLLEAATKRPGVAEYIAGIKGWRDYENGRLSEANIKENTKLGEPRGKIEIEDDILY